jgi:SET domain-containing protein
MDDVYVAESAIHGVGVFAGREFAAGETVLVLDDSRVVDEEHPLRPELGEYEYHCDYLEGGKVVLQGYPERHVNSSCDPNAYARRTGGGGAVVARRAIKAGEEITCDYIIDCHGGIVWRCNCGSPRCRRVVPSSFFELPVRTQLEYLPLLNDWFVAEHRAEVEALRRLAEGRVHDAANTSEG